ncbi:MAG: fatty acid desaturase [Planctomycetota bacterium]
MSTSKLSNRFSIREAKSLIKDLSVPKAWIYWTDFLATISVGIGSFTLLRHGNLLFSDPLALWGSRVVAFAVTAALFMRATMFIHELVHLPRNEFRGFRIAWNALCGIPFLIPSFLYYPHVDHHRRKHYGTDKDGEYLDLSHRHPTHVLGFVAAAFVVPFAAIARFLIMTPIAWVFPGFRGWVERRASSMIIDVFYLRGDYGPEAKRVMRIQEVFCFLWCVGLVSYAPIVSGQWIDGFLVTCYLMAVTLILINNVRTLGAHRWTGDGGELSFEEQLLDSVNYPYRPWITELWGPVGTRYHALHHLFPSLPYHNLGIAHRRLAAGLPSDSIYHETTRVTLVGAILELWQRASHRKLAASTSADEQGIDSNGKSVAA